MSSPTISVIIPVYNGARYLAEAIEGIQSQTSAPAEVIVVDDGSTDATPVVAQRYPQVHYCRQVNRGAGAARNRGVALAHGQWFAFLDADDLWLPDKLARQKAVLEGNHDVEAVLGYATQFFSPEIPECARPRVRCPATPQPAYIHSAMLIRREAFLRVGLFNESLPVGEVIEWFTRADQAQLKTVLLPDVIFRRRLHTANQGLRNHQHRHTYVQILKASLERKRQATLLDRDAA